MSRNLDPKGLYQKARAGEIPDFTGIHQPYESPEVPELRLPTSELSLQESTAKVLDVLRQHGLIPS